MSNLSDMEHQVLAYFVAEHAADFTMADRFYPYGELTMIWEDKVNIAARKFGPAVRAKAKPVATALVDLLIERGAYSTKKNDFGGTMHNFKPDVFRQVVKDIKESDPVIQRSREAGAEFWIETFAGHTGATGQ